jgi:hypothetical protein
MLMVNFCCLRNRSAMAPGGCRKFGNEVCKLPVFAPVHFVGSGTLVVPIVLSWRAWSRCRKLSRWSKRLLQYRTI